MSPSRVCRTNVAILLTALSATCGAADPLTNGVPVTDLSGSAGSEAFYIFAVPAHQDKLAIRIFGGTGDCDLYVRRGMEPTTTEFDYRPYMIGNDETVAVAGPPEGTWHIMLRGYSPYSGLSLVAAYSAAGPVMRTLTITAPEGGSVLTPGEGRFRVDDGTILTLEAAPADAEYAFRTWSGAAAEKGKVGNPGAARTTIVVDANYTLEAVFQERAAGPALGFSLGEIQALDPQEYDYRVVTNNTPEATFVERVTGFSPDPEGMIRMRPMGQESADAKGRFGRCQAERVLVQFQYLFETPEATEIAVYLSDVPQLLEHGDPARTAHYREIGRVYAPPRGRPGSFGSGRFGTFERWAFVQSLDLSNGTWVELELAGTRKLLSVQGDVGAASADPDGWVLIDGWAVEVHCSGYCLDLNYTKTVDSDDLGLVIAACGSTAELDRDAEDSRYCLDGAWSCDGYVDIYDVFSLLWASSDMSRVDCGSLCRVPLPLMDPAVAASDSTTAPPGLSRSIAGGSSWAGALMVLYKGPAADRFCLFDRDGIYADELTITGPPLQSTAQIIRGAAGDLYIVSTEDGVLRMGELVSRVIPPGAINYGPGTVYIGIQGEGPNCFGRPVLDVAFDSAGYAYVVPVVVKPLGEAVYVAAARLRLRAGQNPPYQVVTLYDDLPPSSDNLEADHLREIEVDGAGNVYIVNVHRLNESCMLWKYAPDGRVLRRVSLLDPNSPTQVANPIALHVSHDGRTLYVACGCQDRMHPDRAMLFGLSTQDFALLRRVTITGMPVLTSIAENPATGALSAVGFSTAQEAPALPWLPPRFTYTPLMAGIPADAETAQATPMVGPGDGGSAIPLSITWTGAMQ